MKLLFDANLSPDLVMALSDLYPKSAHVFDHGNIVSDDEAIWEVAKRDDFVIVTKDTDFLDMSLVRGAPPKVVLVRTGNVPTARIGDVLRRHAGRIRQFLADPDEAVLIVA